MLGDTELQGSYNLPLKNNVLVLPKETGVEIGENLLLVKWVDDTYLIIDSDVYENMMFKYLETKGYNPNRFIQSKEVRELKRTLFGRMVEKEQEVRNGYKITLSHTYDGVNRVVLHSNNLCLQLTKEKAY